MTGPTSADPASADWNQAGLSSAGRIAAAVRSGAVRATDVIAEHRDRSASSTHAVLNVFVNADWEGAMRRAAQIDEQRAEGRPLGTLAGVPVSVKDILAVQGFPVTLGTRAFRNNLPTETAGAVRRLEAAGAIIVGKTNLPEFAFGTTCDSPVAGRTLNPLDHDRSPGGSSGGEAAAVASGISAIGIGTDYGGSLRWPAACVGITAIRPSIGRVQRSGQLPGSGGDVSGASRPDPDRMQTAYQVVGPLARDIDDLILAFTAIARPAPARVREATGPLRIGWTAAAALGQVRAETVAAIAGLARSLGAERADAAQVDIPLRAALDAYNAYRVLDPLVDHLAAVRGREDLVGREVLSTIATSTAGLPAVLAAARLDAARAAQDALRLFDRYDVLILPVAGGPACLPDGSVDVDGVRVESWELMGHCRAITLLGAPSVSIPIGRTAEGLPLSVQIVTRTGADELALSIAQKVSRM
jgi:amidase